MPAREESKSVVILLCAILFVLIGGVIGSVSMLADIRDTIEREVRGAVPFHKAKQ